MNIQHPLKVKIKVKEGAKAPERAHPNDAGLDLFAHTKKMSSKGYLELGTGVHMQIPEGHVGLLFPRSSISNVNMSLTNSVGVIDSNYRGEILLRFKPTNAGNGFYNIGDKIGQIVIMPYPMVELLQVDELEESDRGNSGFGSTGE